MHLRHKFGEANPDHIRGLVDLLEASDIDFDVSALTNLTLNHSVAPSIASSVAKSSEAANRYRKFEAAFSFRSAFFDLSEKSDLVTISEVFSPATFFVQRRKFSRQLLRLVLELELFWKENIDER